MELTTKSICVLLRVCGIAMCTHQCICLYQRSFVPNGVLWGTCTGASSRGLRSQAFCCVCLCTYASACIELASVSLCSQRSSVVHMHMDPSCLLSHHSMNSSIVSGLFPHYPPLFLLYVLYQCHRCPSSLLHGCSWLGCQDLPAMGAVSSRS